MADPLLSSLCTICHIHTPKYTCPRCSIQTCSLPCIRRHKLWSSCSGKRDPTAYKPRAELLTAAGIDHDYNFLHSIEHGIERSEKVIVEERGIITRKELIDSKRAEDQESKHNLRRRQSKQKPGEECIKTMLKIMGTKVHGAPKGMQRNTDNGTNWSKNNRQINWQVELLRNNGYTRHLAKFLNNKTIGYYYDEWFEENKRKSMTDEQRREHKKRKAVEIKERASKRAKLAQGVSFDLTASSRLQNPNTGAWDIETPREISSGVAVPFSPNTYHRSHNHQLYLLRPLTSTLFPKVLAPIDASQPLSEILRGRDVLEFPTIYVFEESFDDLPPDFILEEQYLEAFGRGSSDHCDSDSNSTMTDDDQISSEDDASDEEMEDGEIDE